MSSRRSHPYRKDPKTTKANRSSSHGPIREHGVSKTYTQPEKTGPKERPTRTLFVRNINYEVRERDIRDMFKKYGEIKRVFNLIEKRGMVFVTYYDIRAAEDAKKETQGKLLNGRSIDIHYALPKDAEQNDHPADPNTGTLFITLKNMSHPPSNSELRRFFEKWGEIREVRDCKGSPNQKFVEFFDLRDCEVAYKEGRDSEIRDGFLDVKYAHVQRPKDERTSLSKSDLDIASRTPVNPNFSSLDPKMLSSSFNPVLNAGNLVPYNTTGAFSSSSNFSFPMSSSNLGFATTNGELVNFNLGIPTSGLDFQQNFPSQLYAHQLHTQANNLQMSQNFGSLSVPNSLTQPGPPNNQTQLNASVQQLQLLNLLLQQQQGQQSSSERSSSNSSLSQTLLR